MVELLNGDLVEVNSIFSYRVVHLSIVGGPAIVKVRISTNLLGETVERTLKTIFESPSAAYEFVKSGLEK